MVDREVGPVGLLRQDVKGFGTDFQRHSAIVLMMVVILSTDDRSCEDRVRALPDAGCLLRENGTPARVARREGDRGRADEKHRA